VPLCLFFSSYYSIYFLVMQTFNSKQLFNLRNVFSYEMLKAIEDDETKIDYFYQNILPSISINFANNNFQFDEYREKHWICTINGCNNTFFKSKNFYVRHAIDIHGESLPGNGEFLESKQFDFLEQEMNEKKENKLSKLTKHLSLDDNNTESLISKSSSFSNFKFNEVNFESIGKICPLLIINENNNVNDLKYEAKIENIDRDMHIDEEEYWLDYFASRMANK
jgi:hypothetical protein